MEERERMWIQRPCIGVIELVLCRHPVDFFAKLTCLSQQFFQTDAI